MFGWRAMYCIAAVGMCILAVPLRYALPHDQPEPGLRYGELVRSIVHLALTQPVLREAAMIGGMLFGAFSSFWATLVFFLATPPYHYGPRVAGMFGTHRRRRRHLRALGRRLTDRKGPGIHRHARDPDPHCFVSWCSTSPATGSVAWWQA